MNDKSAAIVSFLGNLMPLYTHEDRDGIRCARSLQDGTLIQPVDESDWNEECGIVRIHWQGDAQRESLVGGEHIATLALDRYVRLHGVGASEEAIAAELWFMAEHFHFETGCHVYLPQLFEPPHPLVRAGRKAVEIGQGILVNLMTPGFEEGAVQ